MAISRRSVLGAGLFATAGIATAGLAGCSRGGGGEPASSGGSAALGFTWWGNDVRNELTTKAIEAYTASTGVTFTPQPGEWTSYWDRLATQTAGNDAPDVIQMDEAYISEYASRGALLDLGTEIDTSKFLSGIQHGGDVDGVNAGIPIAVSTLAFLVNPAVFEAAGVAVPDDTTWTWEEFASSCAEVTANSPEGTYGATTAFTNSKLLRIWLREQGTDIFTADGAPGFTTDQVAQYLQLVSDYSAQGVLPPASVMVEDATAAIDQSLMATGKAGVHFIAANQVAAFSAAAGQQLLLKRWPSLTGNAADRAAWLSSSSLFSVSARSANTDAAIAFIDWWVNSTECAEIVGIERGTPPNTDSAAAIAGTLDESGVAVSDFLASVEADLGPAAPLLPPGGATADAALTRAVTDALFGQASITQAAQTFVDDVTAAVSGS